MARPAGFRALEPALALLLNAQTLGALSPQAQAIMDKLTRG